MEADFWTERWELGQTAWDQAEVHPSLSEHWGALDVSDGGSVFVPLCGKSVDMIWLAEQGHRVIGSELSEIGVREFFAAVDLAPAERTVDAFTVFEAGPYEIWCGDFFELPTAAVADAQAVYDRASIVALPPDMRRRYADHLATLLVPGTVSLLVTFVYPQGEMNGPPFAVTDHEVRELFGTAFDIELLVDIDAGERNSDLLSRGASSVHEELHLLRRR